MTTTETTSTAKTFQGKPCRACGGTLRYTRRGLCVTCTRGRYHKRREKLDGREFVYECYSPAGELLYVGRTNHPSNRIYTHRQESPWWSEVARLAWVQVPDLERQRIIAYRPKYNKHGNG
jgi:hypothetical protein